MKQIEVTIMGQSYVLGCPDGGEAALLDAVGAGRSRDERASAIAGKIKARERIAVLAALNLGYQLANRRPVRPVAATACVGAAPGAADAAAIDIDSLVQRIDNVLGAGRKAVLSRLARRRAPALEWHRPSHLRGFYISLNRCSREQGLGTSLGWCDRLASDEPEDRADLAHLNPWVQECGPRFAADTFLLQTAARPNGRSPVPMRHWLMKSEPSECSIDDLARAPRQTVPWVGVRSYQARNFMRDEMQVGDGVLFYHSSCARAGRRRTGAGGKPRLP